MKICRLKIIKANISENGTVSPQIMYVSQNKTKRKKENISSSQNIYSNEFNIPLGNIEEIFISKENNSTNVKLQDIINSERNKNKTEIKKETNNIKMENDKIKKKEEIKFESDIENKYPYSIVNKKRSLNYSLKHIFKERLTGKKSKDNLNLSLPKLRRTTLFATKNTAFFRSKFSKSLPHSFNNSIKFNNKNSKGINQSISNNLKESESTSFWKIIEENDFNYSQNIDYKTLIDELINKECNLVKQKEEIIKLYEEKIKSLKELNNKLVTEKKFVLNREDELNGELILLKNQYENIFRDFKKKFIREGDIFNIKQKEIDDDIKKVNTEFKNGEYILITKPKSLIKLTKKENKYITYLIRGIFFSHHLLDTDKIVDLIWKTDKKFQTIYFLVKELMKQFNLNIKENQNLLINYIYSFCKNDSYIHKNEFKSRFKKKIGKIKLFNKYIQMSKLMNYHKRETESLINAMKKKDIFSKGVINFTQFKQLFYNIAFSNKLLKEEQEETMEFIIYCMKKNCTLKLSKNKKNDNDNVNYSIYDLFYLNLNDFIDEHNSKIVKNPFKLIKNYMDKHNIVSAEKLLRPILIPENIIKKDSKDYIDEIILKKYLRHLGIIKNEESISINTFEEELVDINDFINDIYTKDITDQNIIIEENKGKINNIIDDIFNVALGKK